ncbi:MAG: carboxypeptidase-like regulatory domain-containing protein, partial [Thermoguttaceae bacterium]
MMAKQRVTAALAFLSILGSCFSVPILGGDGVAGMPPPAVDVALGEGGLLSGLVVDAQGKPAANMPVSLQDFQNQEIASVVTNPQGQFAIRWVRGGVYQLITPKGRGMYRFFVAGAAPPSARPGA